MTVIDTPTPRRCMVCQGSGGSREVPCLTCGGSGWTLPKGAVNKQPLRRSDEDDLHQDIPF